MMLWIVNTSYTYLWWIKINVNLFNIYLCFWFGKFITLPLERWNYNNRSCYIYTGRIICDSGMTACGSLNKIGCCKLILVFQGSKPLVNFVAIIFSTILYKPCIQWITYKWLNSSLVNRQVIIKMEINWNGLHGLKYLILGKMDIVPTGLTKKWRGSWKKSIVSYPPKIFCRIH